MSHTFSRDAYTWLNYLMLAYYGYFLNVLGPITPYLKDELALSYTVASLHFTAFAFGLLLVGLGGHVLIHRIGRWRALWLGAGGIMLSGWLLISAKIAAITIGASFILGLVGSLILVVVPSALSDQHGKFSPVAISESNTLGSLAATVAPLLVGFFALHFGSWRLALGTISIVPVLFYFLFKSSKTREHASTKTQENKTHNRLPPVFWGYWLALVLAVSVEFCMISWSADFVENVLGLIKARAAQSVSLFFGGMVIGRWTGSRLALRFSAPAIIMTSLIISAIGFALFWKSGSLYFGLTGLFLTGLGVASLYPMILALMIASAPNKVQASTRAALGSGTAIMLLPLTLGRLADVAGINAAYGVVAVLIVGVLVMVWLAMRISSRSVDFKSKLYC